MILANIKFAPRDKENTFLARHGIFEHLGFYGTEEEEDPDKEEKLSDNQSDE